MGLFNNIDLFADETAEKIEKNIEKESDFYKMAFYRTLIMKLSFKNKILEAEVRREREKRENIVP